MTEQTEVSAVNVPNQNMNQADNLEAIADKVPDAPAVTVDDSTYTFREFDGVVNQIGHLLRSNGVEPGDHVALFMRNLVEHIAGIYSCMKIRAVGINVNFRYTEKELEYLFDDSDSVAVMVESAFSDKMAALVGNLPKLRVVFSVGEPTDALASACAEHGKQLVRVDEELPEQPATRDFPPRSGDDTWVLYTGGTTGMPKGVQWRMADYYYACLSGGNPYGDPKNSPEELAEGSEAGAFFKVLISAPLMHGAGSFTIHTFLNLGGHVILQRDFDPMEVLRGIEKQKPGILVFVGDGMGVPIIDAMVEHHETMDLSSLFSVSSGGGIWSKGSRDKLLSIMPDLYLRDNVGASESGNDGELEMNAAGETRMAPSPKIDVVNEELERIEPGSDEIGYIIRRGHVPLGYYGDPDKTARTFPVVDDVRVSLLGDMGRVESDGTIVFLGRGSGVINTGGEKVFPEEVEQALKAHPRVYDAVVAGAPDSRFGEAVAAVVSPRGDDDLDVDEVRAHLQEQLANYKVPKRIVVVDEVKRSPAGKADYRWAKDTVAAG